MPKSSDTNKLAKAIVDHATMSMSRKNPAAVSLGRLGGLKGGKARAAKLTAKKRSEIAQMAAKVRWSKKNG